MLQLVSHFSLVLHMYNLISVVWVTATEGIINSKLKTRLGGEKTRIFFLHINKQEKKVLDHKVSLFQKPE